MDGGAPTMCKCGQPRRSEGQRYCRDCHNAYMRSWRPAYSELSVEERTKSNARAYANVYSKRGKLTVGACAECGTDVNVEKHHDDYGKPLQVKALCRMCHVQHHRRSSV